jgi:hypothetical protein
VTVRRILAACALVTLVALHLDTKVLLLIFFQRERFHRTFAAQPNAGWPEYPLFLQGVRAHTKPGDRIAVVVPRMAMEVTYGYAYYRATYFLAGRDVLPLYYRSLPRPENLAKAEYLAVWQAPAPAAQVVWQGHGGVLLSRR